MSLIILGGAGADGKTTVLELLSKYLASTGAEPLIIDANPDQNVASFLGLPPEQERALPKICDHWTSIRDRLEGGNPDYPVKDHIAETSPLTPHSVLWDAADALDPVLTQYSTAHAGMRLMRTGTYEAKDIGAGCLHDKIGALTFLLNHMDDGPDGRARVTFVDNAHGRDSFGTPLYAAGDLILVVATPEKKSIDIMLDYLAMAEQVELDTKHPVNVAVVGNRFSVDPDIFAAQEKIFRHLTGDRFAAALRHDDALARGLSTQLAGLVRTGFNVAASSGQEILEQVQLSSVGPQLDRLSRENLRAIEMLAELLQAAPRDYERRREWTQLCLNRSAYLDKTDPSIRQKRSSFVPYAGGPLGLSGHRHGPDCRHD